MVPRKLSRPSGTEGVRLASFRAFWQNAKVFEVKRLGILVETLKCFHETCIGVKSGKIGQKIRLRAHKIKKCAKKMHLFAGIFGQVNKCLHLCTQKAIKIIRLLTIKNLKLCLKFKKE